MSAIRLFPYQVKAVEEMRNGCILCGGVGSGKSLTALSYYYLRNGGDISSLTGGDYLPMDNPMDLYIITTARKRDTLEWDKELSPFLMSREGQLLYSHKIVIDSWNNVAKYKEVENAFFIFDEQRVVGKGVWVKSFLKIAKSNQWILLSATPGDTWEDYIPVFLANGYFKNRSQFSSEHMVYAKYTKFPKVERYLGVRKLERLRDSLLVNMDFCRGTIAHHETVDTGYDMTKYKKVMRDRWDIWNDQPIENAGGLCLCLRHVVNEDESRKNAVVELQKKHPKVIVFYNFNYELEALKGLEYLEGTKVAEWNGHVHQPIPEGDRWVYLVQYAAGNEGWNCILTDTMIFYSQNYSYKVMTQAAGRIDRLNTPFKDLYYYHLKSHASIDLAIGRALREKKNFNERGFVKW